MLAQLLGQEGSTTTSSAFGVGYFILVIVLLVIYLIAYWKLFTKMGQPGWVGIVPILNAYAIYKLAGKEWWWVVLLFIPCVNLIALWVLADSTAKLFGKEIGWTILLFLLPGIGHLILAFGDSQYVGPREQIV